LEDRVLEPVRKVFGLDEEAEGAFGSKGYLPHGLPSKAAVMNPSNVPIHRGPQAPRSLYEPFCTTGGARLLDRLSRGSNSSMPTVGVDRFEDRAHMISHTMKTMPAATT